MKSSTVQRLILVIIIAMIVYSMLIGLGNVSVPGTNPPDITKYNSDDAYVYAEYTHVLSAGVGGLTLRFPVTYPGNFIISSPIRPFPGTGLIYEHDWKIAALRDTGGDKITFVPREDGSIQLQNENGYILCSEIGPSSSNFLKEGEVNIRINPVWVNPIVVEYPAKADNDTPFNMITEMYGYLSDDRTTIRLHANKNKAGDDEDEFLVTRKDAVDKPIPPLYQDTLKTGKQWYIDWIMGMGKGWVYDTIPYALIMNIGNIRKDLNGVPLNFWNVTSTQV